MSIIGGAVIPVVQGFISDSTGSMRFSFIVNFVCFLAIFIYFVAQYRSSHKESLTTEATK